MTTDRLEEIQSWTLMRPASDDITFVCCRTKVESQRTRRGAYWFTATVRYQVGDEDIQEHDFRVCFQPDQSEYYIARVWLASTEELVAELMDSEDGLVSAEKMNADRLKQIRTTLAAALTTLSQWHLGGKGAVLHSTAIGRFLLND